jgi:hypothetical protein
MLCVALSAMLFMLFVAVGGSRVSVAPLRGLTAVGLAAIMDELVGLTADEFRGGGVEVCISNAGPRGAVHLCFMVG